jgi:hypothetical protein
VSPAIGFARGLAEHPKGLPELSFAWLEAPLAARLARLDGVPGWDDLETWPAGRVFGRPGEYRWQRCRDGRLHAVLLLESGTLPEPFAAEAVQLRPGRSADLVLWGEWVDPGQDPESYPDPDGGPRFYSPEIPDAQTYPMQLPGSPPPGATPRLTVRRYRDLDGSRGEFLRCVAVRMKVEPGGMR